HAVGFLEDTYVSPKENAGMHSMCFHPQWPDSSAIYVHYVSSPEKSKIVRLKIDQNTYQISGNKVLFNDIAAARSHNGSRMTIDNTGNIMISIGDAYQFDPAQDINSTSGKVLRFTPTGEIPKDNPFPNSYTWSYGHRNPQGLVFASNGILYSSEHGPTTDDEINLIQKGQNYGWPKVNGYCDLASEKYFCEQKNVIEPIWAFTPTAAPSGLTYYDRDYFPELNNHLLQCFLKGRALCALELSDDGKTVESLSNYFENDFYRLRDVEVAQDGSLYLSTSNLERTNPPAKPNDDKIIHVTQHGLTEKKIFSRIKTNDGTIEVTLPSNSVSTKAVITTFYGAELAVVETQTNKKVQLSYTFTASGNYWLKFQQEGRIVTKRIHVKAVH
ncbi:Soluble aldose sugar dehydrogenase YliI, partial [Exaiptasia diaphana]